MRHLPQAPWVYDPWSVQARLIGGVPQPVIFDVGANVGQTLERYMHVLPGAVVHSFEPFPESYRHLAATAAVYPAAKAHEVALADVPGERVFHTTPGYHTRDSLLVRPTEGRRYYHSGAELREQTMVKVETLDRFCSEHGIDHVNILKMDVQGAEHLVLSGAENLLARSSIDLIYSEVMFVAHYEGGLLFHELASRLDASEYSVVGLYDLIFARNAQLRYGNALFVSATFRSNVLDTFTPEP